MKLRRQRVFHRNRKDRGSRKQQIQNAVEQSLKRAIEEKGENFEEAEASSYGNHQNKKS